VRQPDVTVDCGPIRDDALESTAPTAVFEVLSPSTRTYDLVRKVDEYKNVPSLRHIVLIDPDQPRIVLWSRPDQDTPWRDVELTGDLELSLDLLAIGAQLTLSEVYEDLEFAAG
jgi:Uma2 family endonuclease